jgi:hypothetical protein
MKQHRKNTNRDEYFFKYQVYVCRVPHMAVFASDRDMVVAFIHFQSYVFHQVKS